MKMNFYLYLTWKYLNIYTHHQTLLQANSKLNRILKHECNTIIILRTSNNIYSPGKKSYVVCVVGRFLLFSSLIQPIFTLETFTRNAMINWYQIQISTSMLKLYFVICNIRCMLDEIWINSKECSHDKNHYLIFGRTCQQWKKGRKKKHMRKSLVIVCSV